MYVGWKDILNENSVVSFRDIGFFLVSGFSKYKGFLVYFKFMENVLWTRGGLTGERDREDTSLDSWMCINWEVTSIMIPTSSSTMLCYIEIKQVPTPCGNNHRQQLKQSINRDHTGTLSQSEISVLYT